MACVREVWGCGGRGGGEAAVVLDAQVQGGGYVRGAEGEGRGGVDGDELVSGGGVGRACCDAQVELAFGFVCHGEVA